ncbi:hypothetical protein BU14_0108s0035 [Porphyra umbilicalis]|uniref:Uncharacterized protein n=1 Tax=Porphyra umbilicalis TaxID=2786 RepID=A0A1X6PC90_PORUM|nr:hypothetical protein BU14_0108s0035 [Porphyra umbilicalis]|eukprot:OSX78488.1 hypothetical protein BU14_0108s0035 [Porphyra umbilicalis]
MHCGARALQLKPPLGGRRRAAAAVLRTRLVTKRSQIRDASTTTAPDSVLHRRRNWRQRPTGTRQRGMTVMLVAVAVVTPLLRLAGHAQETAYLGASALGLNSLAPLEPATHARDSGVAVAMSTRERLARPPPTPTPPQSHQLSSVAVRPSRPPRHALVEGCVKNPRTPPTHAPSPRHRTARPRSSSLPILPHRFRARGATGRTCRLKFPSPPTHAAAPCRGGPRRSGVLDGSGHQTKTRRHQAPTPRDQMLCPPALERRGRGDERPTAV